MKLATWNVNGIRACVKKGFISWVEKNNFDIVCLQETKANIEQINLTLSPLQDRYQIYSHDSVIKKGYSGVATLVHRRLPAHHVSYGIGKNIFDQEGRTVILSFDHFHLINAYFPNGQRDHQRVPFKLEFSEALHCLSKKMQKKDQRAIFICGDYNTAHQEIDLKNPKTNQNTTGFLKIERAWIDHHIQEGHTDLFRYFHPDKKDQYTWWSQRPGCREKNIGWRLDYFFSCPRGLTMVHDCQLQPRVLGSDHCPVVLTIS
jgi:exodeoxyribonuclease-3